MQSNASKTNPRKDGVIITVYVESPKSHNNSHQNKDANALKKMNPKTPKSRGRGYDRRAQLLAYSRDLRNLDSPLKSKKWKLKVRSETAASTARYERVGMGERREGRGGGSAMPPQMLLLPHHKKETHWEIGFFHIDENEEFVERVIKGL